MITKEQAIEVLSKVLGGWGHGCDADYILAKFEEKLDKLNNKPRKKNMCLKNKTKICNLCHECDVDVLNPSY